ncbi:hypothetical protein [Methylobacterium sp. J-077]|uniref:hypothetical protein n=1 Tax=Methylobacterium sp. J-077 TaxID=2836656 RepID=UPI001FBC0ADD|nr:hypothetical protein [Methylobacterium sp. J-077]MCJ2124910.1 hypothetical protein [Methylobacterium sp. J-077]
MRNAPNPTAQVHEEEPDIDAMFAAMAEQAARRAALAAEEEPDIDALLAWMAEQAARKA